MERKFNFSVGEFYHLYNRGVEKRDIFLDGADKDRFIKLLFLCNSTRPVNIRDLPKGSPFGVDKGPPLVAVGAYALMTNHFHLLLHELSDGGISVFMLKLLTGYSMYFNKKYGRIGPLFQKPSKATHLDEDRLLKYIFAYIHLNPVKLVEPHWKESGIVDHRRVENFLRTYQYSSFNDYLGDDRQEKVILSREHFPPYFEIPAEFSDFISDWLKYKG